MTPQRIRIVSWNCNEGLSTVPGKAERLLSLDPDIVVAIEVSSRVERVGDLQRVAWVGNYQRRGLAVFGKPHLGGSVHEHHDPSRQFFLPVEFGPIAFRLLAVWAMNYRGTEARPDYGRTHSALAHYREYLLDGDLVIGDFNDNVRWDRPNRPHFETTTRLLGDIGFENLYYVRTGEQPSRETAATFYFHRDPEKPYFIDHAFLRRDRLEDVSWFEVGRRDDWLAVSDHMPIGVELKLPGLAG